MRKFIILQATVFHNNIYDFEKSPLLGRRQQGEFVPECLVILAAIAVDNIDQQPIGIALEGIGNQNEGFKLRRSSAILKRTDVLWRNIAYLGKLSLRDTLCNPRFLNSSPDDSKIQGYTSKQTDKSVYL